MPPTPSSQSSPMSMMPSPHWLNDLQSSEPAAPVMPLAELKSGLQSEEQRAGGHTPVAAALFIPSSHFSPLQLSVMLSPHSCLDMQPGAQPLQLALSAPRSQISCLHRSSTPSPQ